MSVDAGYSQLYFSDEKSLIETLKQAYNQLKAEKMHCLGILSEQVMKFKFEPTDFSPQYVAMRDEFAKSERAKLILENKIEWPELKQYKQVDFDADKDKTNYYKQDYKFEN